MHIFYSALEIISISPCVFYVSAMRNIGFPERKRKKHKQVSESLLQRFFISGVPNEFLPYIIKEETPKTLSKTSDIQRIYTIFVNAKSILSKPKHEKNYYCHRRILFLREKYHG